MITEVVLVMGSIIPAYMTSYNYIKSIFIEFVKQTGRLAVHHLPYYPMHYLTGTDHVTPSRIQGEDALAKMTKLAYSHFSCGYFEEDTLPFSLMLTTEVSAAAYNVIPLTA